MNFLLNFHRDKKKLENGSLLFLYMHLFIEGNLDLFVGRNLEMFD